MSEQWSIKITYSSAKEAMKGDFSVKERRKLSRLADKSCIQLQQSSWSFAPAHKVAVFCFKTKTRFDNFIKELDMLEEKSGTVYSRSFTYPSRGNK